MLRAAAILETVVYCHDLDAAERRFQHMLAHANGLGLYAEEIDVGTGGALGNFPQAFTHVAIINTAVAIERASA